MTTAATKPTILHVEDEALNLVLLRVLVSRMTAAPLQDATIVEVSTVKAALETLAERSFDLVLLDIQLPDGSGLDVARAIAAMAEADRPAVIALTAGALRAEREAAQEAGCREVVTKPYAFAELESILASTLASA